MALSNMLRGISGEFEIVRCLGATGVLTYIWTAAGLEIFEVVWRGKPFDLATFCTVFPAGLLIAIGAVSGSAALKDRNVAKATADLPAQPAGAQQ